MAEMEKDVASRLLETAIKQGSFAVLSAVLLWAFWTVVVQPSAELQQKYTDALIETAKTTAESTKASVSMIEEVRASSQATATSTAEVSSSVRAQEQTLLHINQELMKQSELRQVAMETMTAFASSVSVDHPDMHEQLDENGNLIKENGKKLDEIIDAVKRPDDQ